MQVAGTVKCVVIEVPPSLERIKSHCLRVMTEGDANLWLAYNLASRACLLVVCVGW
jgi:hypothetical protein